jgi:deferrochelatase/peroxidase EfeB
MPYTNVAPPTGPDLSDIQGLIVRGYTHPCSVHLLFEFSTDTVALPKIQGFFKALVPFLQNAEDWGPLKPQMMLNIGLTANGIDIVRPDLKILNPNFSLFPATFFRGPWDANLAQQSLGDYGEGAPDEWWNKRFTNSQVHCVVHAYAMNPDAQDKIVELITAAAKNSGSAVTELLPLKSTTGRLEQYPLIPSDYIHFKYRDSIDEPDLDQDPAGENQADLNNFLIGYSTIQGAIPGPIGDNPSAAFAKNGCYNAFRILYQDVEAFDNFLTTEAAKVAPMLGKTVEYTEEWIAAKLNGRWRNGSPLVLSPVEPEHSTSHSTKFGYLEDDMKGLKCPFSAHNRVANPRDEGVDPAGSTIVPRIIRRGMAYGPPYKADNASESRGLIGLFLCGDINSQFETLYGWINNNNFSPVYGPDFNTQDALIANRGENPLANGINPTLIIPMANSDPIILPVADKTTPPILPQFIVTVGTAYFLLPSISVIKSLAGE